VLAVAGRYLGAEPAGRWRWSAGIAAALLLGLLRVDDPYFAYLVGLPLVAGCLFWFLAPSPGRATPFQYTETRWRDLLTQPSGPTSTSSST
jgi:hypothetical protein